MYSNSLEGSHHIYTKSLNHKFLAEEIMDSKNDNEKITGWNICTVMSLTTSVSSFWAPNIKWESSFISRPACILSGYILFVWKWYDESFSCFCFKASVSYYGNNDNNDKVSQKSLGKNFEEGNFVLKERCIKDLTVSSFLSEQSSVTVLKLSIIKVLNLNFQVCLSEAACILHINIITKYVGLQSEE
jgi:hypothetical protein